MPRGPACFVLVGASKSAGQQKAVSLIENAYQLPFPPSSTRHWTASCALALAPKDRDNTPNAIKALQVLVIIFAIFLKPTLHSKGGSSSVLPK